MKKSIGILTTYFATNFGAMLQPFALKRTLENMGFDAELIRYKQPKVWRVYSPWEPKKVFRKNIMAAIFHVVTLPWQILKRRRFFKYMRRHVQSKTGFVKEIDKKDFYIVGSDQIWNPAVTGGFDEVYWGNFKTGPESKKISYAASAEDIDYNEKNVEYIREHLMNFSSISVREESLAVKLQEISRNDKIESVVDPTVLADKSIYDEIRSYNPLKNRRFVLLYKIRRSEEFLEKIYEYALSVDADLLILSTWIEWPIIKFARSRKRVHYKPAIGVEGFLGAVKHAECVFTPSFHGCVFPILFHRPFFSLVLSDNWNTRTTDFLASVGLSDRQITIKDDIINQEIDYQLVDNKIDMLRQKSMSFLSNALV